MLEEKAFPAIDEERGYLSDENGTKVVLIESLESARKRG